MYVSRNLSPQNKGSLNGAVLCAVTGDINLLDFGTDRQVSSIFLHIRHIYTGRLVTIE